MVGRVFSGVVVAFWLVMMTALVRMEMFPKESTLASVPPEVVLKKIFANAEPARLNVYYRKKLIGACRVAVQPLLSHAADPTATTRPKTGAYLVNSDLRMELAVFGNKQRVRVVGTSMFGTRYDIKDFKFKADLGDSVVDVRGDDQSQKVDVLIDIAGEVQHKQFDFRDLTGGRAANVAEDMGVSNAGEATQLAAGLVARATTQVHYGNLPVGEFRQRSYLVESRADETMWVKIWVDESGQVMLLESSMGITMRADVLDGFDNTQNLERADRERNQ